MRHDQAKFERTMKRLMILFWCSFTLFVGTRILWILAEMWS